VNDLFLNGKSLGFGEADLSWCACAEKAVGAISKMSCARAAISRSGRANRAARDDLELIVDLFEWTAMSATRVCGMMLIEFLSSGGAIAGKEMETLPPQWCHLSAYRHTGTRAFNMIAIKKNEDAPILMWIQED